MTATDWRRVLDEATEHGVRTVQFIGGEPTLHPDLPELICHALGRGLAVEVFTNLVHITDKLWSVFELPGVSLATSYYSDDAEQHRQITGRPSHPRTRANIAKALERGIPLRAGLIDLSDGQRVDEGRAELVDLGVPTIGYDRLRGVGRGAAGTEQSVDQLCGRCGDGTAAVGADGSVWPCVFSRWLPVGTVKHDALAEIIGGPRMSETTATLNTHFEASLHAGARPCDPQCGPNCGPACLPQCWPTGSGPCAPKGGCQPNYD